MGKTRKIRKVIKGKPVLEGAGVRLSRVFGFGKTSEFDPFLLLDDFRADDPRDYLKGFPWHPHRGIETITYILDGQVEHGDSMGNQGMITPRRRPVDDGRQRHHPPGDAQGGCSGPHGGLPALGQPPGLPQDDGAPLPRREKQPDPGDLRRKRRHDPDHLRRSRRDQGAGQGHRHRSRIPRRDPPGGGGVHPPHPSGAYGHSPM